MFYTAILSTIPCVYSRCISVSGHWLLLSAAPHQDQYANHCKGQLAADHLPLISKTQVEFELKFKVS